MTANSSLGQWPRVYFDCNSTTPLIEEAADAASLALHECYANPSSLHWEGCRAKALREGARGAAARLFGAQSDEITFTSGATESIHTAIFGALLPEAKRLREGGHRDRQYVIFGATEHKVVPEALKHWVAALDLPFEVLSLPVDRQGHFNLEWLAERLSQCFLLCTMAVNNETGLIQDLDAVSQMLLSVKERPFWLVDGVQALGKVDLKWSTRPIDFMAFSGHKVHAPKGTGLLVTRKGSHCVPLLVGGGQEAGRRSGTEPLPALAGFGRVLELMVAESDAGSKGSLRPHAELKTHRSRLITALESAFEGFVLNVDESESVPTTINFSARGYSSAQIWMLLEAHGVFVSSGSACQSAKLGFSHVLRAMGLEEWRLASAARLSFGLAVSPREIDAGVAAIHNARQSVRDSMAEVSGLTRFHNGVTCAYLLFDHETGLTAVWGDVGVLGDRIKTCLLELASRHGRIRLAGVWELVLKEGRQVFQKNKMIDFGLDIEKVNGDCEGIEFINPETFLVSSWGSKSFARLPLVIFASQASVQLAMSSKQNKLALQLGLICEDSSAHSGVPFLIKEGAYLQIDIDHPSSGIALEWDEIQTLSASKMTHIVDIREQFEQVQSSPFHSVRILLGEGTETHPFSQIGNLIRESLEQDPGFHKTWIFVCRSGTRSRYAAELFRFAGWKHAYTLKDGLLGNTSRVGAGIG